MRKIRDLPIYWKSIGGFLIVVRTNSAICISNSTGRPAGSVFHFITRSHSGIQKMRFADRIRVETDPLPDACKDWPVPRLI